jgi:hypothetical protein
MMLWGGRCNLENRDDGAEVVGETIDDERVKEVIIGRGWDVGFVVKRYIAEHTSKIDLHNSPSALVILYWRVI